jgi:PAS domain S-box-containing protein
MTADGETQPGAENPRPQPNLPGLVPVLRQRRRSLLAAAGGFVLLALACVLAAYLAWRTIRSSDAVLATAEARRATIAVVEGLLAVESAQRALLLTQEAPEQAALQAETARLDTLLAPLPGPGGNALRDAVRQAQAQLQAAAARGATAPAASLRDPATRQAMAQAQATAARMVTAANITLDRLALQQRRLGTQVVLAIVACLVLAAALAVLLLRDTRRHVRQLALREARLHDLSATLDQRVAERTRALTEVNLRFEIALSATGVTVALQDRALRFTWISKGEYGHTAEEMVGRTDEQVNPDPSMASVTAMKRAVADSGEPARREIRVVHAGAERWLDLSVQPMRNDSGAIIGIIAAAIDVTHYKEQETRIRLLMREVTHRSLNLLAVIEAITRQTANNATSVADFEARFSSRLQSLAGSHDLLVQEDWSGASLRALVRSQLGHFADITDSQTEITGPPLHLQPDAAQHIGMALHELAANAARYGALSVPGGRVVIAWRLLPGSGEAGEKVELSWHEVGGPPVAPPTRRGFGRLVIERTVARGVQGEVKAEYLPEGLHWTLTFPASFTVRT